MQLLLQIVPQSKHSSGSGQMHWTGVRMDMEGTSWKWICNPWVYCFRNSMKQIYCYFPVITANRKIFISHTPQSSSSIHYTQTTPSPYSHSDSSQSATPPVPRSNSHAYLPSSHKTPADGSTAPHPHPAQWRPNPSNRPIQAVSPVGFQAHGSAGSTATPAPAGLLPIAWHHSQKTRVQTCTFAVCGIKE